MGDNCYHLKFFVHYVSIKTTNKVNHTFSCVSNKIILLRFGFLTLLLQAVTEKIQGQHETRDQLLIVQTWAQT